MIFSLSRRSLLIVGVLCLGAGGWLIGSYLSNQLPNPDSSTAGELLEFMSSDRFSELDSTQRQVYVEKAYANSEKLSPEDGARLASIWSRRLEDDQDGAVKGIMAMATSMMMNEVNQYTELPPKDREAFWRRKVAAQKAMAKQHPEMAARIRELAAQAGGPSDGKQPGQDGKVMRIEKKGADGMKMFLDAMDAADRAKMVNMMRDGKEILGEEFNGSMMSSFGGTGGGTTGGMGFQIHIGNGPGQPK